MVRQPISPELQRHRAREPPDFAHGPLEAARALGAPSPPCPQGTEPHAPWPWPLQCSVPILQSFQGGAMALDRRRPAAPAHRRAGTLPRWSQGLHRRTHAADGEFWFDRKQGFFASTSPRPPRRAGCVPQACPRASSPPATAGRRELNPVRRRYWTRARRATPHAWSRGLGARTRALARGRSHPGAGHRRGA